MTHKQRIKVLPAPGPKCVEMSTPWDGLEPDHGTCAGGTANDHYEDYRYPVPTAAAACTGPGCINLNVQRELLHLKQCQTQLEARERSLFRCLARNGLVKANGAVHSFFVEPVLEALEDVYGTADVLARYMAQEHVPGSACQYLSLIEQMEMRLKLYLRIGQGEDDGLWAEMMELFGEDVFNAAQIVELLPANDAAGSP